MTVFTISVTHVDGDSDVLVPDVEGNLTGNIPVDDTFFRVRMTWSL
jgi:hypothetical protein